ncbi:MAG TPA: hypothetical protein VGA36_09005, partial [Nitriliruptorales bacterium]
EPLTTFTRDALVTSLRGSLCAACRTRELDALRGEQEQHRLAYLADGDTPEVAGAKATAWATRMESTRRLHAPTCPVGVRFYATR